MRSLLNIFKAIDSFSNSPELGSWDLKPVPQRKHKAVGPEPDLSPFMSDSRSFGL